MIHELRDRGLSIRTIAALTGLPKSTVGERLRGYGEYVAEIRCERCGRETIDFTGHKRFCSHGCRSAQWADDHPERVREIARRRGARLDSLEDRRFASAPGAPD
jgi:hypothetical protein